MSLNGRQIRDARLLLGLSRSKLALKVGRMTTTVIIRAEKAIDEPVPAENASVIRQTLERLGIEFTAHGVRLRTSSPTHTDET